MERETGTLNMNKRPKFEYRDTSAKEEPNLQDTHLIREPK